jgi:hypothetical protein
LLTIRRLEGDAVLAFLFPQIHAEEPTTVVYVRPTIESDSAVTEALNNTI